MLCLQSSICQSNNHIPHASLLIVKFYNYDNFRETCAEQIYPIPKIDILKITSKFVTTPYNSNCITSYASTRNREPQKH